MAATTIDPQQARHFGALAADWWNPKGSSAMLHRLNPARLRYIRAAIDAHWGADGRDFAPLGGKTALDCGCGAGLVAEPLARLGAAVTAIDAAPENIGAARTHAAQSGLAIDYRVGSIDAVAGARFDLIVALEVVEHVTDPARFVSGLAAALTPGGLLIMATPNRTALSRLALIAIGEGTGQIPRGTHDWDKFLTPDELRALAVEAGLRAIEVKGLGFSLTRGFVVSDDTRLDYFLAATTA